MQHAGQPDEPGVRKADPEKDCGCILSYRSGCFVGGWCILHCAGWRASGWQSQSRMESIGERHLPSTITLSMSCSLLAISLLSYQDSCAESSKRQGRVAQQPSLHSSGGLHRVYIGLHEVSQPCPRRLHDVCLAPCCREYGARYPVHTVHAGPPRNRPVLTTWYSSITVSSCDLPHSFFPLGPSSSSRSPEPCGRLLRAARHGRISPPARLPDDACPPVDGKSSC